MFFAIYGLCLVLLIFFSSAFCFIIFKSFISIFHSFQNFQFEMLIKRGNNGQTIDWSQSVAETWSGSLFFLHSVYQPSFEHGMHSAFQIRSHQVFDWKYWQNSDCWWEEQQISWFEIKNTAKRSWSNHRNASRKFRGVSRKNIELVYD